MNEYLKLHKETYLNSSSHKWDNRISFTPKDVHEMLGVPLSTIYALCYNKNLKAFKVGGRWLIHRDGLFEFLQTQIDHSIIL